MDFTILYRIASHASVERFRFQRWAISLLETSDRGETGSVIFWKSLSEQDSFIEKWYLVEEEIGKIGETTLHRFSRFSVRYVHLFARSFLI